MGLPGEDLVLLAATIAITIAKDLSNDDIALFASLLDAIADNLGIIVAKRELLESDKE